jgi:hypothetical protein
MAIIMSSAPARSCEAKLCSAKRGSHSPQLFPRASYCALRGADFSLPFPRLLLNPRLALSFSHISSILYCVFEPAFKPVVADTRVSFLAVLTRILFGWANFDVSYIAPPPAF